MCRRRDACRVPSLNWVLIIGLVFCCPFQWGFLYNLGANKFEPRLELSSGAGGKGLKSNFERARMSALQRAEGAGGGSGVPELIRRKAWLLTFPFFPVPMSPDHLLADLVITIDRSQLLQEPIKFDGLLPLVRSLTIPSHRRVSPFSREVIFKRARVSLALNLVPRAFPLKNGWGAQPIFQGKSPGDEVGSLSYPWGKMGTTRSLGVHCLWYESS